MRRSADSHLITLTDSVIEVVVDPAHGADVLTMRHRASGHDVLFATPWRSHADDVVDGTRPPTATDPVARYVERYRGGWNTLCPNAGAPRTVHGAPLGFHGEVVNARWDVVERTAMSLRLRLKLFSVPVLIERELRVEDGGLVSIDRVHNLGDVPLDIDYVSHLALGGAFVDGHVTVASNARKFTADPETHGGPVSAGTTVQWPGTEEGVDLGQPPTAPHVAFGWLSDFDSRPWVMVTNHDLRIAVRVTWDGEYMPYAWFWQELNGTAGFPWYRRARAVAIEPATTVTSGPGRERTLHLNPRQVRTLPVALCIIETEDFHEGRT